MEIVSVIEARTQWKSSDAVKLGHSVFEQCYRCVITYNQSFELYSKLIE